MNTGVFNRWRHESKATQVLQYRKEKKVRAVCKGQWKSRKVGEAKIQKQEKKATAILPVNTKKASFRAI